MRQKMRPYKSIVLFLIIFLIAACAPRQVVLTPDQESHRIYWEQKEQHNQALKAFVESQSKYNVWCETGEYEEICVIADPMWLKASEALDIWGAVVDKREPLSGSDEAYWTALKALKTKLIMHGFAAFE